MSKRTSVLLPDEMYERLQRRARQHGITVSDEIRDALERECVDENPNQGWLALTGMITDALPGPSVDSDEFKEEYARSIYRDSFNREDDNPNQWLLDFAESLKDVEWKPGPLPSDPNFKQYLREEIANRAASDRG